MSGTRRKKGPDLLRAMVANAAGEIFELPGYAAVGMAGPDFTPLEKSATRPLPYGSELMLLPDRGPIVYNLATGKMERVPENPHVPGEPIFPVAAFNSPGYVATRVSAYEERPGAKTLPLFSYGAVGWHGKGFRSAVVRVDAEPRQDLRKMSVEAVARGLRQMRKEMPRNRLRKHLETCAMTYGCPAAKNFFLGRYEAPLPTARTCNARCLGCLSLQKESPISCSQERIGFTPSPREIAEVALAHIGRVKRSVVSFGQGCEGDPLMAAEAIAPAIRLIRSRTARGTINVNTNGSRPDVLEELIDAGLDSVRISLNSVRESCYRAYFRPRGYGFSDVIESIDRAAARSVFVSINLLNMAGFTDTVEEGTALEKFLRQHPVHMIQWRNLNYDPLRYWAAMGRCADSGPSMGMGALLDRIRQSFPDLIFGYFNPPREKFGSGFARRQGPLTAPAHRQGKEP